MSYMQLLENAKKKMQQIATNRSAIEELHRQNRQLREEMWQELEPLVQELGYRRVKLILKGCDEVPEGQKEHLRVSVSRIVLPEVPSMTDSVSEAIKSILTNPLRSSRSILPEDYIHMRPWRHENFDR